MNYGKVITKSFDKNGNYNELEQNYVDGEINSPISRTIEERVKIYTLEEELEEYRKFSEFIHSNSDIVRPSFKLDTSRAGKQEGYYFVIKCYTKLERFEKV